MSPEQVEEIRAKRREDAQDFTTMIGSLVGALVGIHLWDTLPLIPRLVVLTWGVGAAVQWAQMLADLYRWSRGRP